MNQEVRILHTGFVTHDVKQFIVTRPDGFAFEPGQGVELAMDEDGWREEGRPFTPTSLPDEPVLEFTIKGYPQGDGMTRRLHTKGPGERLLMSDPFGTITYQGPGTFIAGGAGVTPFLAIFRTLATKGKLNGSALHFSNRTPADIICEKELRHLLGDRCHLVTTHEEAPGYLRRRIDAGYLKERLSDERFGDARHAFYVCGPPEMVDDVTDILVGLGVASDRIVVEE